MCPVLGGDVTRFAFRIVNFAFDQRTVYVQVGTGLPKPGELDFRGRSETIALTGAPQVRVETRNSQVLAQCAIEDGKPQDDKRIDDLGCDHQHGFGRTAVNFQIAMPVGFDAIRVKHDGPRNRAFRKSAVRPIDLIDDPPHWLKPSRAR
jgi:hypothetical protein